MSGIYDLANRIQERQEAEQKIVREKAEREKEKVIERNEKQQATKSDRKFIWKVSIVSAIVGSLVATILTLIVERFFK